MVAHLERLARNQVLFREVNERLRELLDERSGTADFLCECSNEECIETVSLEIAEYERVRSRPNLFVVSRGHEIPAIEKVVHSNGSYVLVEKTEGADYVVRTDPRGAYQVVQKAAS